MPDIAGLKLIVPTSATATGAGSSATVSATGKVTFTSAATISVNGCFTASYDNYLLVIALRLASGNEDVLFQMRASGTNATGTNYTRQYLLASSTSVSGARESSQTSGRVTRATSGTNSGTHFYLYGPNLAQPTATRSVSIDAISSACVFDAACTHSLSTAYDGVTILPSAGALTGTLTAYGLSQ